MTLRLTAALYLDSSGAAARKLARYLPDSLLFNRDLLPAGGHTNPMNVKPRREAALAAVLNVRTAAAL